MADHKYTDEQIIEALEIRMPHDVVCREAYDLIKRQQAKLTAPRNQAIPSDGEVDEFDVALAENMFTKHELAKLYVKKLTELEALKK